MGYTIGQTTYYLRHWKMLEKYRDDLSEPQIVRAKMLFNSLKKLNEKDLQILKEKFYDSQTYSYFDKETGRYRSIVPINDETMALKKSLNINEYRKIKGLALSNLRRALDETEQEIANKERFVRLRIKKIYVRDLQTTQLPAPASMNMTEISNIMVGWESEARIFDTKTELDEIIVNKLESMGFSKESVQKIIF